MRRNLLILFFLLCVGAFAALQACSQSSGTPDGENDSATSDVANGDAGPADAPPDGSDGGCMPTPDFSTDPANCGRCGHDCLGGACQAGVCQAAVLAFDADTIEPAPIAIAMDNTGAYWVDQGKLLANDGMVRHLSNSGTTPTSLATNVANPFAIAVDAKNVYFETWGTYAGTATQNGDGQVIVCPTSGCQPSPTVLMGNLGKKGLTPMAASGTSAYWVGPNDTNIYTAADGADAATSFISGPFAGLGAMTADSAFLYYAFGVMSKKPLGVGGPLVLDQPTDQVQVRQLAVTPTAMYQLRAHIPGYTPDLATCPQPNCAGGMVVLLTGGGPDGGAYQPFNVYGTLAADATNLYFIDDTSFGTNVGLMTCMQSACTPTPLTFLPYSAIQNGVVLGVNDTAVFLISANAIIRVAK